VTETLKWHDVIEKWLVYTTVKQHISAVFVPQSLIRRHWR